MDTPSAPQVQRNPDIPDLTMTYGKNKPVESLLAMLYSRFERESHGMRAERPTFSLAPKFMEAFLFTGLLADH